ncbi:MAG: hypothetical protein A3F83_06650 [Candidatus Glassbacteria bacterium RIFCSPLOWO2_12_FULL_58_11]|uniref:Uncharacterized protein n=2 Tax=Candidatus Glassiibacteriota TaxID=1817805 RepID=A0A1F5YRU6_9BACT|nr:MAG: hypothetical protein A2Z86_07040 [Candidatus Glassbacteria bacterium GWA2_58_10]OGG02846.1 MAG: hypothetical protein A3F83_06650 [Candidatus Glassbacteria bacterium RIFCSPLOWO2_12_FULL_58_11]
MILRIALNEKNLHDFLPIGRISDIMVSISGLRRKRLLPDRITAADNSVYQDGRGPIFLFRMLVRKLSPECSLC